MLESHVRRSGGTATGGINPVRFREIPVLPVPFGEAPRAGFQRQSQCFEPLVHRPPGAVHNGCVFEGGFPLGLDARQHSWSVSQKDFQVCFIQAERLREDCDALENRHDLRGDGTVHLKVRGRKMACVQSR